MVPDGGTDLVSTYGVHVSNFWGGGVNLDPHFQTLHQILDIFHFRGGGKLGPSDLDSMTIFISRGGG